MNRLFGTDGVRGIAGTELTPELAFKLGFAGAHVLAEEKKNPVIFVGSDTRISCDLLEHALISGILSAGASVKRAGIIPTPALSFLVRQKHADAGVMISASHNPAKYNGIKFFSGTGYKLPDETEDKIQHLIEENDMNICSGADIGRSFILSDAEETYAEHLTKTIRTDLSGLKLCIDCANGATYSLAPRVLRALGAEVFPIFCSPDGLNINQNCGSTHMETLSSIVKTGQYDLGIAFDGDGDRVLMTDRYGNYIDGDQIMAVSAIYLKEKGLLKNNTLVATVMSNLALELTCKEYGIILKRTAVGDRYVLEEMQKGDYILGGEQSGHIIFSEYAGTGDGILSCLQFLQIMKETGKSADELCSVLCPLPQVLKNIKVPNEKKKEIMENSLLKKAISEIEIAMCNKGRVLLRPSGTEPQIRIMLEGENLETLNEQADSLSGIILSLI